MRRALFALLVGLSALSAGAGEASHTDYLFDPAQFRQHAEEDWFHLYWNYRRPAPDVLEAEGYVTAKAQSPDIEVITLELAGLDGAGELVSRALGTTRGGKIYAWESRPFAVRLHLTGLEKAFRIRTWHLRHHR